MEILDRILVSSVGCDDRTVNSVFGILVEEVGEVATAIYRPQRCTESATSEIADVINAAVDLVFMLRLQARTDYGLSTDVDAKVDLMRIVKEDLTRLVALKCDKWDGLNE